MNSFQIVKICREKESHDLQKTLFDDISHQCCFYQLLEHIVVHLSEASFGNS